MQDAQAIERIRAKYQMLRVEMDERFRRQWAAAEARELGWGGVTAVAIATGLSRTTVTAGLAELELPEARRAVEAMRVRRPGGGRHRLTETDPGLLAALEALIEPGTRGDPQSPLRWTCKSTRRLAEELSGQGHPAAPRTVASLLDEAGYSLQANSKTREGRQHPDRDAQFRHINTLAEEFLASGDPVISVDTKKKELVGRFAQAGREWHPEGEPVEVSTYNFPSQAEGKAIPYGVYDLNDNSAWVSVGIDHDTSVFAVATIDKWWQQFGKEKYPDARRILITADGGGSNGHRPWLWKFELARLAKKTGLHITVCHYPPGTSKWNKIEHRLFSRITHNWRGRPLETYQTIVNLIANTTTTTGLTVRCELDPNLYPTKIKLTDQQKESIPLARHEFHGEWNYAIEPQLE